eukprot:CAMPEP_0113309688 /NCGR_PEP_ID=MMETSP0010_2-20120614/7631_1 /TAXON_ID=216773 ORGANISM="Corethron hystrix, Strain 308" /NCGR_SAMPLE_ID=MMETSP0010_2 /ASSEMBLY_ACC=CAM_ASM_000155 /LENGTH=651 /DNA_ID=CAMNT_0000164989 /DNA_START=208 /DNA_END=2160 /DNA_ORIENTATION=+ /assembly_acc=CAM_ASM_000155
MTSFTQETGVKAECIGRRVIFSCIQDDLSAISSSYEVVEDGTYSPSGVADIFLPEKSPMAQYMKSVVAMDTLGFDYNSSAQSRALNKNSASDYKAPLKSILRRSLNSSEGLSNTVQSNIESPPINFSSMANYTDINPCPGNASTSCSSSTSEYCSTDTLSTCNECESPSSSMPIQENGSTYVSESNGCTDSSLPPNPMSPDSDKPLITSTSPPFLATSLCRDHLSYYLGTPILPVVGGLNSKKSDRRTLFNFKATGFPVISDREYVGKELQVSTEKDCFFPIFKRLKSRVSSCPEYLCDVQARHNHFTESRSEIQCNPNLRRHHSYKGDWERRGRVVSFDSRVSVIEFERSAMEWYDDALDSVDTDEKIVGCLWKNFFPSLSQSSSNLFLHEHEMQSDKERNINGTLKWISSILASFKGLHGLRGSRQDPHKVLPKVEKVITANQCDKKVANDKTNSGHFSTEVALGPQRNLCLGLPYKRTDLFNEVQSILVVDCHDIFLNLFSKGLKNMMPHVQITTAKSVEEALLLIEKARSSQFLEQSCAIHGFDVIILEENLDARKSRNLATSYCSDSLPGVPNITNIARDSSRTKYVSNLVKGSDIIKELVHQEKIIRRNLKRSCPIMPSTLLIGVSISLQTDETTIRTSGADMIW